MKIEEVDNSNAKKILIGLITDARFLAMYSEKFAKTPLFTDKGSSFIEKKCIEFYNQYLTAPSKDIVAIYQKAVREKQLGEDNLAFIEDLLKMLSKESDNAEKSSSDFLMDCAIEHLNVQNLAKMRDELDKTLSTNNIEKAKELVQNYKAVEKGEKLPIIKPFEEVDKVKQYIFKESDEQLIQLKGDAGRVINSLITRKSLVFIRAKSKGKKSYFAQAIANLAFVSKRKVLYISLGDLTEKNMNVRLYCGLLIKAFKKPMEASVIPHLDCYRNKFDECLRIDRKGKGKYESADGKKNTDYIPCSECRNKRPFPFTVTHSLRNDTKVLLEEDVDKCSRMMNAYTGGDTYRELCYSANELTASGLQNILKKFAEEENWVPDIVIPDHIGQFKCERGTEKQNISERMGATVSILNNIRKNFNCCVLVPDHAVPRNGTTEDGMLNDESYSASASKDKDATAVILLNTSPEDNKNRVQKLTTAFCREGSILDSHPYLLLLQDLDCANMLLDSYMPSFDDVKMVKEFEKEHNINQKEKQAPKKRRF